MATQRRNKKKNDKALSTVQTATEEDAVTVPRSSENIDQNGPGITRRIIQRALLSFVMIAAVYWSSKKDNLEVFAAQKSAIPFVSAKVPCSASYIKDVSAYEGCAPKFCGRIISDNVVTKAEATHLLRIFKAALAHGGSNGGASILDLHTGALSYGNKFINIYQLLKGKNEKIFTREDFQLYTTVRRKIHQFVAFYYHLHPKKMYLTSPTFFSEMTSKPAVIPNDEYWHLHIDKETYPAFHYTTLLYLSDYNVDFTGGRFIFVEQGKNISVEPKFGRMSSFTSGAENPHFVEKVKSGTRYALTISFTCDSKLKISDPKL